MKTLITIALGMALTGCATTRSWDGERAMGELFSHYDYATQDYVFKASVDMDCIDYYNKFYAAGAVNLDHKALEDWTNRYLIIMAEQCAGRYQYVGTPLTNQEAIDMVNGNSITVRVER